MSRMEGGGDLVFQLDETMFKQYFTTQILHSNVLGRLEGLRKWTAAGAMQGVSVWSRLLFQDRSLPSTINMYCKICHLLPNV